MHRPGKGSVAGRHRFGTENSRRLGLFTIREELTRPCAYGVAFFLLSVEFWCKICGFYSGEVEIGNRWSDLWRFNPSGGHDGVDCACEKPASMQVLNPKAAGCRHCMCSVIFDLRHCEYSSHVQCACSKSVLFNR